MKLTYCPDRFYTDWSNSNLSDLISPRFKNLNLLSSLKLQNNNLTGAIPKELGQLNSLEVLCLSNNRLTDLIPIELGRCKKLKNLDLSYNDLVGEIPTQLENCKAAMEELYLQFNFLQGEIPPSLGNLIKLRVLKLNNNVQDYNYGFTKIPEELGCIANKLEVLHLHNNQIEGQIPERIDQRTLKQLDLIYGNNNGLKARRYDNIRSSMKIIEICWKEMGGNIAVLHGEGGDEDIHMWKGVTVEKDTVTGESIITQINWSNCRLGSNHTKTKIHSRIGDLGDLTLLNLEDNKLTGNIPKNLGNCEKLKELYLRNNKLDGEIPSKLGNCTALVRLSLRHNKLSGRIPKSLFSLKKLKSLKLNNNELEGEIDPQLGKNLNELETFHVHNNHLTGEIPSELDNNESISLQKLQYHGNDPTTVKNYDEAKHGKKKLCATDRDKCREKDKKAILDCWTKMGGKESKLYIGNDEDHSKWKGVKVTGFRVTEINWSDCKLSKTIPDEIGDLQELIKLNLSENKLSGEMNEALSQCKCLTSLNISSNDLKGEIPYQIFQHCTGLVELCLRNNKLSGDIPSEIGKLKHLAVLKLNNNAMTGEFPQEALGKLVNLKQLHVHNNQV